MSCGGSTAILARTEWRGKKEGRGAHRPGLTPHPPGGGQARKMGTRLGTPSPPLSRELPTRTSLLGARVLSVGNTPGVEGRTLRVAFPQEGAAPGGIASLWVVTVSLIFHVLAQEAFKDLPSRAPPEHLVWGGGRGIGKPSYGPR